MARAWKNKHGVAMGGLLIDTLAHRFLTSTTAFDDKSYLYYDWMVRDFFEYLSELDPGQMEYGALGSGHVAAWSKGGATDLTNCELLCITHNRSKGNR